MNEETSVITTEFKAMRFTYNSTQILLIILLFLEYFINKNFSSTIIGIMCFQITVFELSRYHFKRKVANTEK